MQTILVTGGAGYVGGVLTPRLLTAGYHVRVLDLYLFGEDVLHAVAGHPHLEQIKGDIRDQDAVRRATSGCDAVIHLACISNDPSFELDPALGRSINFDAFAPLVRIAKQNGVKRFIYASTCSVYGISDAEHVTEDHELLPITDYNKYKGLCEPVLLEEQSPDFAPIVIRPATLCGHSPRQRLDLTVNILTNHAVNRGSITVFGGQQTRPNLHIEDMVDLYVQLLDLPVDLITGKTYNAGYENHTIARLSEVVRDVVREALAERRDLEIVTTPSNDRRSYRISSEKIKRELGFEPKRTISSAVRDLVAAFQAGKIPNPGDSRYHNVMAMQEAGLR